jgi:23S rRNA pseudouridine1911/1915/1917 synthase
MIEKNEAVEFVVELAESGWRLDFFLAHHLPQYSRMHLRRLITAAGVEVDDKGGKPSYRLKPGQRVRLELPDLPRESPKPENIPLDVIYEDDSLAVINKPPGMVVHPARGHWSGTLTAALAYRFAGQLSSTGGPSRPGIVHRLDRDTSGAIIIAKNDTAHKCLAAQFEQRLVEKEYLAIAAGVPDRDRDWVDFSVGPHPTKREKMMVVRKVEWTKISHRPVDENGEVDDTGLGSRASMIRHAETFYEVVERFKNYSLIRALPKTGRTHQVRLHLTAVGLPILCDLLYGRGEKQLTRHGLLGKGDGETVLLARQALHAHWIKFTHPESGEPMRVEVPLPADMQSILDALGE